MTTPILTYKPSGPGHRVDLDRLVASRLLAQANSGGGKSRLLRQLLEETHGRIQHLIIDPEGEFATLRERYDYVLAAKTGGEALASPRTAKLLCRRLVELGASAVLDLYELKLPERREFVNLFLTELVNLPRSLWKPILVVIDEAHTFAPQSGESQALDAVISLCTLGRKRGFCAVLATQRISKLHKDAAAELLNKMIGRTGLDVDVKRAGDELGFDKEGRQDLPRLQPGEFFVYGPAISPTVTKVRTGSVSTTHPEPGQVSAAPPAAPSKIKAMLSQLADLPKEAEQEARTVADFERQVKQLRSELTRAQRSGAERIVEKTVIDERAVQRAVADAIKPFQQKESLVQRQVYAATKALRGFVDAFDPLAQSAGTTLDVKAPVISSSPERRPAAASPSRSPATQRPPTEPTEGITRPQQRILDTIAQFEALGVEQPTRGNIGVFLGVSSTTGGFKNNLSALRTAGYIEYPGDSLVALTEAGRAIANASDAPQSLEEIHSRWLSRVTNPQARILTMVLEAYPDAITRQEIASALDVSPTTGGFKNNLSALRSLGLIDYPADGQVIATILMFPRGLR